MSRAFHFGIFTDPNLSYATLLERWQLFDSLGFNSAWLGDHYMQPSRPDGPYFEGWTLLAALATQVEKIRVGMLVTCNTFRHPALLVKSAVTVDHVTHGRLEFGLGTGWNKTEHERFGLEFPDPPELVERFREAVEIADAMFRQELTTYHGRYYRLQDAPCRPGVIQKPRPPFALAGHRPKMLRIVARHADRWSSYGTIDEMRERNGLLDEYCAEIGRDPDEISRSLYGWDIMLPANPWESLDAFHEVIGRYREVGINDFIFDQPVTEQIPILERVAAEALPALRGG